MGAVTLGEGTDGPCEQMSRYGDGCGGLNTACAESHSEPVAVELDSSFGEPDTAPDASCGEPGQASSESGSVPVTVRKSDASCGEPDMMPAEPFCGPGARAGLLTCTFAV